MIKLRPHHLDEISNRLAYHKDPQIRYRWEQNVEENYGIGFKRFVDDLMYDIFSEPDIVIKIVDSIDTICESCPKRKDTCEEKDTDTLPRSYPYISMNRIYTAGDLIDMIKEHSKI